jgi:hypothetical protein
MLPGQPGILDDQDVVVAVGAEVSSGAAAEKDDLPWPGLVPDSPHDLAKNGLGLHISSIARVEGEVKGG